MKYLHYMCCPGLWLHNTGDHLVACQNVGKDYSGKGTIKDHNHPKLPRKVLKVDTRAHTKLI